MTMVGADADRLDAAAATMRRAADELDEHSGALGRLLGGLSWLGQLAGAFLNMWNSNHKPQLHSTASFIRDAAAKLEAQATQQREASSAQAGTATPRFAPPTIGVWEVSNGMEDRSGAIAPGLDGSNLVLRQLSDGTYEVEITMNSGMVLDVGDAKQLWDWGHGDFFSDGKAKWDLDLTAEQTAHRSFVFSDMASAMAFHEALLKRQSSFVNSMVGGGLSMSDLRDVAAHMPGDQKGTTEWSGYNSGTHYTGSGSFSVDVGKPDGTSVELTGSYSHGYTATTHSSDGSVGNLSVVAGTIGLGAGVSLGGLELQGSGEGGYERQVHVVTDGSGNPLRLDVSETYSANAVGTAGLDNAFIVRSEAESVGGHLTRQLSFDLADPTVAAAFKDAGSSAGALANFADKNATLGAETVALYKDSSSTSHSALLLSWKADSTSGMSDLSHAVYRDPGSSTFRTQP
jgi:hypothetical protein